MVTQVPDRLTPCGNCVLCGLCGPCVSCGLCVPCIPCIPVPLCGNLGETNDKQGDTSIN